MGGRTWRKKQSWQNKPREQEKQRKAQEIEWALMQRRDGRFLQAIWATPADTALRLVYADWLEV
jgi:hypothetical protein